MENRVKGREYQKVKFPLSTNILNSMHILKELIEAGKFIPVIDRSYAIEEVVAAYEYVASGEKTGNVVLSVS